METPEEIRGEQNAELERQRAIRGREWIRRVLQHESFYEPTEEDIDKRIQSNRIGVIYKRSDIQDYLDSIHPQEVQRTFVHNANNSSFLRERATQATPEEQQVQNDLEEDMDRGMRERPVQSQMTPEQPTPSRYNAYAPAFIPRAQREREGGYKKSKRNKKNKKGKRNKSKRNKKI